MTSTLRKRISYFFVLMCVMQPLYAHAGLMTTVTELLSQHISSTDEAKSMLVMVFGDFALDPFRRGAATSGGNVLGDMFAEYNRFIFEVAMVWLAYNSMAGLAQTMHEGVVLGRRMSTVWMPIRMTFGAASLMPVFGGWAFCQALMIVAAMLGIAGANVVTEAAMTSTAGFHVLVNPMGTVKQASALRDVERFVLKGEACSQSEEKKNHEMNAVMGTNRPEHFDRTAQIVDNKIVLNYGGTDGSSACGSLVMKFSPRSNSGLTSMSGIRAMFGFRISNIDYDGIRAASMRAHLATLTQVQDQARRIVAGARAEGAPGATGQSPEAAAAVSLIQQGYYDSYSKIFAEQLSALTNTIRGSGGSSAIESQLLTEMRSGGWATLGIWYGVFAEVNEAMNEMLDPAVVFDEPKYEASSAETDMLSGLSALITNAQSIPAPQTSGITQVTGNRSVGLALMGGVLDFAVGSSSTGASEMVNPIIAFKNIGDNALAIGETVWLVVHASKYFPVLGAASAATDIAGKAISLATGSHTPAGGLMSMFKDLGAEGSGMLLTVALLLFAAAAMMAYYIPAIPFIQWFAALLQWFSSIVESVIGSSLWALAHFDSDGEGMGQRASYGYVYMLNNFARPIIMTFAFFIASASITVLGTFLFRYYGTAIATAQGNTINGLIGICANLIMFGVMGVTLINGAFSIMLHMADRMIGWIGQNAASAIGHDVEQRVNRVFIQAASSGGNLFAPKSGQQQQMALMQQLVEQLGGNGGGTGGDLKRQGR